MLGNKIILLTMAIVLLPTKVWLVYANLAYVNRSRILGIVNTLENKIIVLTKVVREGMGLSLVLIWSEMNGILYTPPPYLEAS